MCSKQRMSIAALRDENEQLKALLAQTQAALSEHQGALAASEAARRRLEVQLHGQATDALRQQQECVHALQRGDLFRRREVAGPDHGYFQIIDPAVPQPGQLAAFETTPAPTGLLRRPWT